MGLDLGIKETPFSRFSQQGLTPVLAKLKTYSLLGIEAMPVDVEVDLSPAPLPKTVIVGLPEQAVPREYPPYRTCLSQRRIHAAA